MTGLQAALKLAQSEFELTRLALSRLDGERPVLWPQAVPERLRWLNVRSLRLKLRVGHEAVARAMLVWWGRESRLPPAYRLLAPASVEAMASLIRESHPRAEAEWRERERLASLVASLAKPLPMADDEAFAPAYASRMASIRRAVSRAKARYRKPFRGNFWLDEA